MQPDHTKLITCKIPKLNENGEIVHSGKVKGLFNSYH